MTQQEIYRMRELPSFIQRARSPGLKLRLARELRALTEQYKLERMERRSLVSAGN